VPLPSLFQRGCVGEHAVAYTEQGVPRRVMRVLLLRQDFCLEDVLEIEAALGGHGHATSGDAGDDGEGGGGGSATGESVSAGSSTGWIGSPASLMRESSLLNLLGSAERRLELRARGACVVEGGLSPVKRATKGALMPACDAFTCI